MVFQWLWSLVDSTTILLSIFTVIMMILYNFVLKHWWYFSRQNVKFIRGWPIIGSLHEFFVGDKSFADAVLKLYRQLPDEQVVGLYELTHPVFLVRDPELIKRITVQDFEHFLNHQGNFDASGDTLMAKTMFFSRDQPWKEMRTVLSPAFTGTKMRLMFELIQETSVEFLQAIRGIYAAAEPHELDTPTADNFEVELKDLLSRYTTNVIATCAFGLKVDAVTERDNEFFECGKRMTDFDGLQGVKFMLSDAVPRLMKWLDIKFIDKKLAEYLHNVVKTTMTYREENDIYRPDMIQLLMQAQKGTLADEDGGERRPTKTHWDDEDLVAQCVVFLTAGFESTSTLLGFMCYELAMHPDIQQRLYDEITAVDATHGDKPVTYETVHGFKYMDMVVSEALRLWPPVPVSDREVSKAYRMQLADGRHIDFAAGAAVWLPIYGMHRNERHWPEPLRFDPERFNDENRKSIKAGTYLPFGIGQRVCIASRFATLVAKTVCYHLLREYRLEVCERTPNPMVLKPNSINMHAKDGLWLRLRARN